MHKHLRQIQVYSNEGSAKAGQLHSTAEQRGGAVCTLLVVQDRVMWDFRPQVINQTLAVAIQSLGFLRLGWRIHDEGCCAGRF
jgi:hypothetical protein